MKAIEINRDSWHHKLAKLGGFDADWSSEDICTYTQAIIMGLIGIAVLSAIVLLISGIVAYMLGDSLGWLAFVILHEWINPFSYGAGTEALAILAFLCSLILGPWLAYRGTKRAMEGSEVMGAMWGSLHERMCVPIRVRK